MKVKVIDMFRDKYTDEVYSIGRELNVDEKRFKEIEQYVEKVQVKKEK